MTARPKLREIQQRGKLPWWTAVLLAASVTFMPEDAGASCGDYVTVAGRPKAAMHELVARHGLTEMTRHFISSESAWPSAPCRGPNCGRLPTQQATPQAMPLPLQVDHSALAQVCRPIARHDFEFFSPRDSAAVTATPVFEIFHPPRA